MKLICFATWVQLQREAEQMLNAYNRGEMIATEEDGSRTKLAIVANRNDVNRLRGYEFSSAECRGIKPELAGYVHALVRGN